jgi:predicted DNA-binding protein YlxM (UPF0122 family)
VCRQTVYNLITSKKLKAVRLTSRITIIRRKDIDAMLDISKDYEIQEKKEVKPIVDFYTLDEILEKYNIKTSRVWQIIKSKNIPTTKFDRKTLISKNHIDKLLMNKLKPPETEITPDFEFYNVIEAMEKYDLSKNEVYSYCIYYKVERLRTGRYTKINKVQFDDIFKYHVKP